MYGELLVILAQFIWAIVLILQKKIMETVNPLLVIFIPALIAALALAPIALSRNLPIQKSTLIYLIIIGILWIPIGQIIFLTGVKLIEASKVSFLALTYPLFVTILSIIFLGEKITLKFLIASILITAGVILMIK
ncbi:MAG: DMT family transporter [Candidatus Aenigmatarchaeota archaeon]